ncbi:ABC transporter substrate-binding protein [Leifsonia xyli]|nr:ABC transporter substrate-binding protein [Leifsonia xyli]
MHSRRVAPGRGWTRKRVLIAAGGVVGVAAVIAATAVALRATASDAADPVAVTVPVALSGVPVPKDTRIGVIVTLGGSAEGSEWNGAAQGARVAQQRLALGGTAVDLVSEDDHGTADGGKEAVRRLVGKGVSGIVIASSGSHLSGAVAAASAAGVPVILPYAPLPSSAAKAEGSWTFAPTAKAEREALTKAVGAAQRPLHIDAGPRLPDGFAEADRIALQQGADLQALAVEIARRTEADATTNGVYLGVPAEGGTSPGQQPGTANDAVIVSGAPGQQAAIVRALQSRNVGVPIILTGSATGPAFAAALAAQGGSVATNLQTVGAAWGDPIALDATAAGRGMSAFLAGNRLLAQDPGAKNLTGEAAFATVAPAADARSHDAVLSLVRAVCAADSMDPSRVASALGDSALGPQNGGAGPTLDFSRPSALAGPVTPLAASGQDLALRPAAAGTGGGVSLVWFPEPSGR